MSQSRANKQSAAERRIAEAAVRSLLEKLAASHFRLISAARRWLKRRLPTAFELVYEYRDWLVISYAPNNLGYEGVLAIRASADGVKLYFNRGKDLTDPGKLLQGSGKQVRWINIEKTATFFRPEVAALVEEAIALNQIPFASTGRGPIYIRPPSLK